jgi:hypothetical protein
VPAGNARGTDHNFDVVNCLVDRAFFTIPVENSNWSPPCDGTVAVVMVVCDENGNSIEQTTIASVPINCACEVRCAYTDHVAGCSKLTLLRCLGIANMHACAPLVVFAPTNSHIAVDC